MANTTITTTTTFEEVGFDRSDSYSITNKVIILKNLIEELEIENQIKHVVEAICSD